MLIPTSTTREARIDSLDLIRGVAVMGILLMNVQSFSMPDAAYLNPTVFGDLSGLNGLCWLFSRLFISQKFSGMFALLFGAGIYLFMHPSASGVIKPLTLHYRRMFWLMLFGLLHFYLLWWGDILLLYALGGSIAILFRHASARVLFGAGLFFLVLGACKETDIFERAADYGSAIADFSSSWSPPASDLSDEVQFFRTGSWWDQLAERHFIFSGYLSHGVLTPLSLVIVVARPTGLMLLGMLAFRSGVLSAKRPAVDYRRLALFGIVPGLLLTVINLVANLYFDFSARYDFFWGRLIDYWAAILMALGYVGVLCLAVQSPRGLAVKRRLQAAGKLAFTNYLTQTLIATTIFYSYGLGWFGQVERVGQFAIALVIIALQLWWSPLVLKVCYFGPLEWLWRCLTYWRLQPLLRRDLASVRVT